MTDAIGSLDNQLEDITDAINSQTTSLEAKLILLQAAMEAQTLVLGDKLDLITTALNTGLADINTAIGLVETAIEGLNTDLSKKLDDIKAAIESDTITINEALEKIILLMEQAQVEEGIKGYTADGKSFFITPSAMSILNNSPELKQEYLDRIVETVPTVTTSQVSSHTCKIAITRSYIEGYEFITETDNTTYPVTTLKTSRVTSTATYTIDKGGCAVGCYEINITDIRGTNITRYNFNGGSGGNVQIVFTDGKGGYVLTGHIEVIMR